MITLVVFLVTYHRIHDMPFMIFFIILLVSLRADISTIFSTWLSKVLFFLTSLVAVFICVFPSIPVKINNIVPENWNTVDGMSTISLILMFILSAWLLNKTNPTKLSIS